MLGAVVISGLIAVFSNQIADNPRVPPPVTQEVKARIAGGGVSFVPAAQVRASAEKAGVDSPTVEALVDSYEKAQINSLKTALLFAAFLVLASFWATRRLTTRRFSELAAA